MLWDALSFYLLSREKRSIIGNQTGHVKRTRLRKESMMNRELLKKNFEAHGFLPVFFDTKEEALHYLTGELKGKKIAFGGSVTVQQMGLAEALAAENEVIWHWLAPGPETLKQAREAEIYITSANAVSETGELVNIDGTGNRVAQTLFGPEKTYFVVGKNKLSPDLAAAMDRARNVAAPKNAVRLSRKTPCAVSGGEKCFRCSSPENICHATVILERPCGPMKVEVVFIDEELGY